MRISEVGLHLVASEEGCLLFAYDDHDDAKLTFNQGTHRYERHDGSAPIGFATIGAGHLIRPGEVFDTITRERAFELLDADLRDVQAALNRQVPDNTPGWNQHRFDALCDFGINCGTMAATKYGLVAPILAQDWPAVETPMKAINKSKGVVLPVLVRRRAREWALFCEPMPDEPIDAQEILARVSAGLTMETEDFRRGSIIPDEPDGEAEQAPPTPRNDA